MKIAIHLSIITSVFKINRGWRYRIYVYVTSPMVVIDMLDMVLIFTRRDENDILVRDTQIHVGWK